MLLPEFRNMNCIIFTWQILVMFGCQAIHVICSDDGSDFVTLLVIKRSALKGRKSYNSINKIGNFLSTDMKNKEILQKQRSSFYR